MVVTDGGGGGFGGGGRGWCPVWVVVLLAVFATTPTPTDTKVNQEQVDLWANKIGDQLWNLGISVTRSQDIKKKYKDLGAKVAEKDGEILLDQIMDDLNQMLVRKMDAVKCIAEKAENVSVDFKYNRCENYTYYSAKESDFIVLSEDIAKETGNGEDDEAEEEAMYYDDEMDEEEEEEDEDDKEFDLREQDLREKLKDDPVAMNKSLREIEMRRANNTLRKEREEENEEKTNEENCKAAVKDECDKTKCKKQVYPTMTLVRDPHFDNIPVNTSESSVQVPTNIFDLTAEVQEGLQWSEELNPIFRQNYASDPSLTWQYFGHSTGFLRLFPAVKWRRKTDMYDCRSRVWYIEAATCTKDIVILVDNSGSMTGMGLTIAKLVVDTILDTLSSNDFVNVYRFNMTVRDIVPCFNTSYESQSNDTGAMLVQATVENKKAFTEGMKEVTAMDNSNITKALIFAFDLLAKERKSCIDDHCNQAIMLVTDNVANNLTDVFEKFNRRNGIVPVRIFTYLLGKDVARFKEAQLISCSNGGYFSHIRSLMDVREEVYKYIPVVARPLVLQELVHPVVWTPLFLNVEDMKMESWLRFVMSFPEQSEQLKKHTASKLRYYSRLKEDQLYIRENLAVSGLLAKKNTNTSNSRERYTSYRLMTAVSVPAFDHKINLQNDTRTARLLGVAGLDVPLEDFEDLTRPHNIGVNGYAFIVTNNGFILMHPGLRPVFDGKLRENYHSIDLTEVEFEDEERPPRDPSPSIVELREAMVNHSKTKMHLRMKYHYDEMRRAGCEERDIYITPLKGTGFSLGLVLPTGYGHTHIKVGDQIKKSRQMGTPAIEFFDDKLWRVHPDWEYCAHFHPNSDKFATVEERLKFFLSRNVTREFQFRDRWRKVGDDYCSRRTIPLDDYYCDSGLVQMIVFDAKLTESYQGTWTPKTRLEEELVEQFRVTQRFIATQGGLTRWQYIKKNTNKHTSAEWGDSNKKTIDEPWYVGAVLQHQAEAESFFFSLPPDAATRPAEYVTATVVIPHQDGGKVALGAVAGYHLPITTFKEHFKNITFRIPAQCSNCNVACDDDHLECFLIDSSGYIVMSKTLGHVGHFFGEFHGDVFDEMLQNKLFEKRTIYDYQALCPNVTLLKASSGSILSTPFMHARWMWEWFFGRLSWLLLQTRIGQVFAAHLFLDVTGASPFFEEPIDEEYLEYNFFQDYSEPKYRVKRKKPPNPEDEGGEIFPRKPKENETKTEWYLCDRKLNLYGLRLSQSDTDASKDTSTDIEEEDSPDYECSVPPRPSYIGRIPHSNLLLVVVDTGYSACHKTFSTKPEEVYGDDPLYHCHKLALGNLTRRRMSECFSHHPLESEIFDCGRCSKLSSSGSMVSLMVLLTALLSRFSDRYPDWRNLM